jgi:hypothetical protein
MKTKKGKKKGCLINFHNARSTLSLASSHLTSLISMALPHIAQIGQVIKDLPSSEKRGRSYRAHISFQVPI